MPRWIVWLAVLAAALLIASLLSSCSDDTAPLPNVEGTYRLTLVGGQPLPATVQGGGGSPVTITKGEVELETTFGHVTWCETDETGVSGKFDAIRWSRIDEDRLRFTYPDFSGALPPLDTVTVSGETMTYTSRIVDNHTWTLEGNPLPEEGREEGQRPSQRPSHLSALYSKAGTAQPTGIGR